ncbi:MAG TPA: ABC transporter permease [Pirellulaceae bacterium]|nr:ABC transporter permease [Pirellulaceae bacterium]
MASRSEDEPQVRRIRTDPFFYAMLGVIGSTYVLLVVGMLLADVAYVFTSDMSERLVLDFSSDGEGKMLATGDLLADRFARYGLSITTDDPGQHQARIIDTDKPSAANSNLGSPHQDFGGPGVGVGGRLRSTGENCLPLGNAIAITAAGDLNSAEGATAELVANWVSPVHLDRLRLEQMTKAGGHAVTYNMAGEVISRTEIGAPAADGTLVMEIRDDEVSRIDVVLADDRALAFLDYTASGQLTANLDKPGRQTVRAGSVRVVPSEAVQIRPSDKSGTIVCQWVDPVEVDEIQLLDINDIGGELQLFDLAGKSLARRAIADLGPNSFQKLRLQTPDVARLEIHLPGGGALAEMHFTWQRRVRSAWQRDHPRLAKVVFNPITDALSKPEIRYSIKLTMISCTITAILSLWVAVPIGYLMSRHRFPGRNLIDAVLDIPIVLPPLVVGLSLLILFQYVPTSLREAVVYQIPAVIIAQFSVACAFAVRTMRATFDQIDARHEQVALTLGCSRMQAFGMIVIPEAKRGIVTAATLAWARSLGEFGPLLVFAGTTRNKTEVLSTTVFLELNVGNLGAAVAVSLIMVAAAVIVLVLARAWGTRNLAV